ncbi:hypothetical protein Q0Z83_004430 [Actinoplanes sichuanensis]|uniref:Transmembrane protein n=1 Tax=Actinoplanes sichuanensis TaxID=512349 RepID=A0ABW4AHF0_9ACTN|nr:hypothetical protein [Actinoplanes sichuanensis]BEL02252.1 hypothetical protein Q0Z83_004430 [Actinoplanes sichuanensis]
MHNLGFALDGAWQVLLAGLALGAGLPILFALGIRSLAWGAGSVTTGVTTVEGPRRPIGTVIGYALFAVVVVGVLLGLTFIVASGFGYKLDFSHVYPTIIEK